MTADACIQTATNYYRQYKETGELMPLKQANAHCFIGDGDYTKLFKALSDFHTEVSKNLQTQLNLIHRRSAGKQLSATARLMGICLVDSYFKGHIKDEKTCSEQLKTLIKNKEQLQTLRQQLLTDKRFETFFNEIAPAKKNFWTTASEINQLHSDDVGSQKAKELVKKSEEADKAFEDFWKQLNKTLRMDDTVFDAAKNFVWENHAEIYAAIKLFRTK